ncbi:MAG: acetoin utilization protein AcuC [Proteobacteria bacterium]|nr:acetoin utilization protein AcuC [Pseudomonadota bacterium]
MSKEMLTSVFIHSHELAKFEFGPNHPHKPERAIKAYELCRRYGVMDRPWMKTKGPKPIDPRLLKLFHDEEYLSLLREASAGKVTLDMLSHGIGSEDNPIVAGIYEWSLMTAGATYMGMRFILEGEADVAFNPLGGFHHARRDYAEGFCYINDVAVAITEAIQGGLRVAFVDIDAHHCNGVQDAFYEEDRALVVSLHETGETLYPGTGRVDEIGIGNGVGYNINIPLAEGTDDEIYVYAFQEIVPPLIRAFQPDFVVAEIGADTLRSDPLTHLMLTNNGYQEVIKAIKGFSRPILALGGGGYDIYRTARCWTLAWSILNEVQPQDEFVGAVGGMMFGPEMEVGSLYDVPRPATGEVKEKAFARAEEAVKYIRKNVFPRHGIEG